MEQQPYQETPAESILGYCRSCGRSVPQGQGRQWQGSLHCMDCIVKLSHESPEAPLALEDPMVRRSPSGSSYGSASTLPPLAPAAGRSPSPILALILGLIPGVGAVYNGQYAKGILHVVVFGGIISALGSGAADGAEPLFGMLIGLMVFYMPIEAFRTARAMERGEPVDEFSGLLPPGHSTGRSPAAGVVLIALGVVFLLQSLGFLRLNDLARFWPLSLIAIGIYLLYRRVAEGEENGGSSKRSGAFSGRQGWKEDSLRPPSASGEGSPRPSDLSQPDVSGRSKEGGA
jgi:hypothetical protein